jgi:hypothetical protein
MGFDKNSRGQPLVNVHKKTTQVNLWMCVGIGLFALIALVLIFKWSRRHGPDEVHQVPSETATPRP